VNATAAPLLEVTNLRRLFPVRRALGELVTRRQHAIHAVDAVSFTLAPGEIVALLGESGCGKSTTGRLLVRLDTPTDGSIHFEGRDVAHLRGGELKAFRRQAQIIFQNPFETFDGRLTIGASLQQALRIHHLGTPAAWQARTTARS
jgi:oligopeptide transport system ATP-binding protein